MGISQRNLTPIFFSFGKSFAKALKVPSGEYCLMLASYNIPVAKSAFVTGGNISTNGGTTAYNTTSDYRSKNNIQPLTDALSRVALLRPVKWTWKEELGGTQPNGEGFIAHELAEILPMAVTGEKDELDEDGKPKYQGVDTRFLVATLTAAIQEQQSLIEALTTRITTLEG